MNFEKLDELVCLKDEICGMEDAVHTIDDNDYVLIRLNHSASVMNPSIRVDTGEGTRMILVPTDEDTIKAIKQAIVNVMKQKLTAMKKKFEEA